MRRELLVLIVNSLDCTHGTMTIHKVETLRTDFAKADLC